LQDFFQLLKANSLINLREWRDNAGFNSRTGHWGLNIDIEFTEIGKYLHEIPMQQYFTRGRSFCGEKLPNTLTF